MKIKTVSVRHADRSIWGHLAEREKTLPLVTPLDIYLKEATEAKTAAAVVDFGNAIKDDEGEDKSFHVMLDGAERIYTVSKWTYERFAKNLDDFKPKPKEEEKEEEGKKDDATPEAPASVGHGRKRAPLGLEGDVLLERLLGAVEPLPREDPGAADRLDDGPAEMQGKLEWK